MRNGLNPCTYMATHEHYTERWHILLRKPPLVTARLVKRLLTGSCKTLSAGGLSLMSCVGRTCEKEPATQGRQLDRLAPPGAALKVPAGQSRQAADEPANEAVAYLPGCVWK